MTAAPIDLSEFDGLGLIVKEPAGVLYTNQVAGYSCLHPQVHGVLVPVPGGELPAKIAALRELFGGDWHSLNQESAAEVDDVLNRIGLTYLVVDRDRVGESFEAWKQAAERQYRWAA